MKRVFVCSVLMMVGVSLTYGGSHAEVTAFVGVDVISIEAGGLLEDQTVVVEDGTITMVGSVAATTVPDSAKQIDGAGLYLMAGLTDVHVHIPAASMLSGGEGTKLQPPEHMLTMFLANGVTTVRIMSGFPELLELRDRVERGEVLGPRLIVCTPMFDGKKPLWPAPFSISITSPEEARAAVRESKAKGYDLIKVYSFLLRDAYDAMMDEAKQAGLKVVGHVPIAVGLERVFAAGQNEVTHVEEYWRFTRDYSDEVVARYTKMTADAGTWFSPTLSTYTNIQRQFEDMDGMLAREEMRYVDPAVVEWWSPPNNRFLGANDNPARKAQMMKSFEPLGDFMRRLVKSLYEAGVPLETGTDVLNPMVVAGFGIHDELQEFVNAGIPELEAIRASTTRPAEFMGEADRWGTIAPGQVANLVLLRKNPLEDIGNTKEIAGVMVKGTWLTEASLDARLEAVASQVGAE